MPLLVTNSSGDDVELDGIDPTITIPARGDTIEYVNVTGFLRGLSDGQYADLETQRATSGLTYTWDGPTLYDTGTLTVSSGSSGTAVFTNVKLYGAAGDGSTDDTSAINAAIAALSVSNIGGTLYFPKGTYKCTGTLNLGSTANILFLGDGGKTVGEGDQPSSIIKYTGTGTRFIDARSSFGFGIAKLCVQYSDTSFAGILIDLSHNTSGADTAYAVFEQSLFCGISSACRLATLISWRFAIFNTVRECTFRFGRYGISGREIAGEYCDGNNIINSNFDNLVGSGIRDLGSGCSVTGCGFEGIADSSGSAMPSAYIDTVTGGSLVAFCNNWLGDAVITENWLLIAGGIWTITGNAIQGGQQSIKFTGSLSGSLISGNGISGAYCIDFGAYDSGTNAHRGVVVTGNNFTTLDGNDPVINDTGHPDITIHANPSPIGNGIYRSITGSKTKFRNGLYIGTDDLISEYVKASVSFSETTIDARGYLDVDITIGAGPSDKFDAAYSDHLDTGLPSGMSISAHGHAIGTGRAVLVNNTDSPIVVPAGTIYIQAFRN